MACDSRIYRRDQTLAERKVEVKKALTALEKLIASGQVNIRIGTEGIGKGAVVLKGWSDAERVGITDACAIRLLMLSGTATTKLKLAAAQQQFGTSINRQTLGAGVHSHDGGLSWHTGH
jgi:hypothetical protein